MSTYLTVSCPKCHALYKIQRVWTPDDTPPGTFYCLSCGQLGAVIEQMDQEATWLEVLSIHYNKPTEQMAQTLKLYETLQRQGTPVSLHEMLTGEKT